MKACRLGDERRALLRELPPRGFTLSSHPSQDGWCALRREGLPGGFTLRSPARVAAPGGALFPLGRAKWSSCRSAFDSPAVRGQAHPGHPLPERALPGRVSPIMPVPGRVIAPSLQVDRRSLQEERENSANWFRGPCQAAPPFHEPRFVPACSLPLATRAGRVKRAPGDAMFPSGQGQRPPRI